MTRGTNDLKAVTFGVRLGRAESEALENLARVLDRPKGEVVRALIREAAARTSAPARVLALGPRG